ncbi:MAG TPA: hypothetical protein VJ696_09315 [Rhodanobacteraceae bacterium]|nr:hypothetical protein [Rhodanobacteraceae bacterium]
MWLLTLVLLILLGLLGIADWLKARRPDSARHLQPIEQYEGLIGAAGLVWGLLLLLRWLSALGMLRVAGGAMLVTLLTALVMLALSLVVALPLLRSMFGDGDFMARVARLAERIAPYRIGLGFACFVLALYSLVGHAF